MARKKKHDIEQQRLFLIPADEVPLWFEIEGKGVGIIDQPQYGRRVTMVISGVVDKGGFRRDPDLKVPIVRYKFEADRSMVLDAATVVDLTSERFLRDMEAFLTAEDFESVEQARRDNSDAEAEAADGPRTWIDPDTGEVRRDDDS